MLFLTTIRFVELYDYIISNFLCFVNYHITFYDFTGVSGVKNCRNSADKMPTYQTNQNASPCRLALELECHLVSCRLRANRDGYDTRGNPCSHL